MEILERYWVRTATPKGVENEYWLEAFPKRISDARLYSKIEIILAREDFLPKAMQIYLGDNERKVFQFGERQVNPMRRLLERDFSKPATPRGWKKVVAGPQSGPPQRNASLPNSDQGRGLLPIPLPRRRE